MKNTQCIRRISFSIEKGKQIRILSHCSSDLASLVERETKERDDLRKQKIRLYTFKMDGILGVCGAMEWR